MTDEELIMKLSSHCQDLPTDLAEAVNAVQRRMEEKAQRLLEMKLKAAAETEKEEKRLRMECEKERRELLCLGSWGEKVPRGRRFSLCERTGSKWIGCVSDDWKDETKWVPITEYCAIDLVRGYMSPYWGYYCGYNDQASEFYSNRIRPVLDADDDRLVKLVRVNWNFFKAGKDREDYWKFSVLDYEAEDLNMNDCYGVPMYKVKITGRSPLMTFKEHQGLLKKEFA